MRKAKINFEIEQENLANAKAYIARHGNYSGPTEVGIFAW